ncbi:MAG: FAD-dependent oxidoreductase [Candidatus Omnitrophica bacterium]|nr:FAD-dependent oxidoreductase [Candidatus Omnitrophota bacterium]
MRKIAILGSSHCAIKIIELLRQNNKEDVILYINSEDSLPYNRDDFPLILKKLKTLKGIVIKPIEFFEQNNVVCHAGKKISRVNLSKKKVFLEDKSYVDFDILLITDFLGYKLPEIKGINKTGVYAPIHLDDISQLLQALPFIETAVIQADGIAAFKFAEAIALKGREVIIFSNRNKGLFSWFTAEDLDLVVKILSESNIQLLQDNSIVEILGDGELRAVRTKTGKVYACDAVIFPEVESDWRVFCDSVLNIKSGIEVNSCFRTNLDFIYACDRAGVFNEKSEKENIISVALLEEQSKIIVSDINKEDLVSVKAVGSDSFNIGDNSFEFVGDLFFECEEKLRFSNPSGNGFLYLYGKGDVFKSSFLLNCSKEITRKVISLIENKDLAFSPCLSPEGKAEIEKILFADEKSVAI